jgi:hypothetical protein
LLWLIDHPSPLFLALLVDLLLCVNLGFHFRRGEEQSDSQIGSAVDRLNLLLSLLLGFTLPIAQPHHEQRKELIVDEANAIATVFRRAEVLPEPMFAGRMI